ncbi:hypothetical protein CDAR_435431 [Caerostris darwini]|uniref:Uncharacterized protein n=1 Tax=Caerostris darwini TaxID=1538125 RepID=A0AAV4SHB7_9ARAC|nr:hypothetical protein CDAR_435431 [Caerostris darwini]
MRRVKSRIRFRTSTSDSCTSEINTGKRTLIGHPNTTLAVLVILTVFYHQRIELLTLRSSCITKDKKVFQETSVLF